jgi:hypothetical protein
MTYYVEITITGCDALLVLNGLNIGRLKGVFGSSSYTPINTAMIKGVNRLNIQLALPEENLPLFDQISARGLLKRYDEGDIVCPEGGEILLSFDFNDVKAEILAQGIPADIKDIFPLAKTVEFESESPDFTFRLLEADPVEDEEALLDWAIKFRDILSGMQPERPEVARDGAIRALYALYEPKLNDYDIGYPEAAEADNFAWFAEWMNTTIIPRRPFTQFRRDQIGLTPWCEKRIWEITLKDGRYLWTTLGGDDGKMSQIRIFVGMVDGKIKIVR